MSRATGTAPAKTSIASRETATASSKASEIKAALTAAKNIAFIQHLRQQANLFPAELARAPIFSAGQRAAERLLTSSLARSDLDKLEQIRAENRAESRRLLQAQQAEAAKESVAAKAAFRSAVDDQRNILGRLASSAATPAVSQVVLDAPFLIWPSPYTTDVFFDDYHIEPWNSWAKFKFNSQGGLGLQEIIFYFLWENSTDKDVVINVDSWLMLNGYGQVNIPGNWFDDELASMSISGSLGLLEWWNQPPTSPPMQPDQFQTTVNLTLQKGFLGSFITPLGAAGVPNPRPSIQLRSGPTPRIARHCRWSSDCDPELGWRK